MEQWSILSNVVNYVEYDRHPRNIYDLDVRTIDLKIHKKIYERLMEEDRQILELDFVLDYLGDNPEKLREDHLEML